MLNNVKVDKLLFLMNQNRFVNHGVMTYYVFFNPCKVGCAGHNDLSKQSLNCVSWSPSRCRSINFKIFKMFISKDDYQKDCEYNFYLSRLSGTRFCYFLTLCLNFLSLTTLSSLK